MPNSTAPLKTGLVSITFRKLSPETLIQEVARAGQQGVEWGGDVHVPHGDVARARQVAAWTRDAGLETAAYGSYYRLGETENNPDIEGVLDCAEALETSAIRVWAGRGGSAAVDEAHRRRVEEDARRLCDLAAKRGLRIALEYHGGTLTDTLESTQALLAALPIPNLDTLWQPPAGMEAERCEHALRTLLDRVSNLHVFHWGAGGFKERYPLADGVAVWEGYLKAAAEQPRPRWALMEFVKDDRLEQYREDAAVLNRIIDKSVVAGQ